jgi:hypothetical protein
VTRILLILVGIVLAATLLINLAPQFGTDADPAVAERRSASDR